MTYGVRYYLMKIPFFIALALIGFISYNFFANYISVKYPDVRHIFAKDKESDRNDDSWSDPRHLDLPANDITASV